MRQQDPHAPLLPLALRVVRGLIVVVAFAAIGCRGSDPWSGTVALPARIDDVRTSVLSIRGVPAGIEERTAGSDGVRRVVVRRRTWTFRMDGDVKTVRSATRTEHDGAQVIVWTDGERSWRGSAFLPDLLPPPATGRWPVLDPGTREVTETWVDVRGDDVEWTVGSVAARATFDDGLLVAASFGALTLTPAPPDLVITPVDPAAALSVPIGDVEVPAHPVVAVFRVRGEEVEVQAPLAEELRTADVTTLRELVGAVGTDGDCEARAARFVGFARDRGLEARVVAGLALDEENRRLVPHAWAEVELGGRWVAVDPTWNQIPADAARLTFGVASRADVAAAIVAAPPVEVLTIR